ncbi:hypothetical protein, partial [Stenotrophomonas sp.]|uniref:hypothetical protein n=1 Tax=Stenotrophomonas sp. TaxID=69392 RepID=UPI002FC630E9
PATHGGSGFGIVWPATHGGSGFGIVWPATHGVALPEMAASALASVLSGLPRMAVLGFGIVWLATHGVALPGMADSAGGFVGWAVESGSARPCLAGPPIALHRAPWPDG